MMMRTIRITLVLVAVALVGACGGDDIISPDDPGVAVEHIAGDNQSGANQAGTNLGGNNQAGMNLAGPNLGGKNLGGANLAGANLAGTNLGGNNLGGNNLAGTNLAGANLAGANLAGTNLAGKNLSQTSLNGESVAGYWPNAPCLASGTKLATGAFDPAQFWAASYDIHSLGGTPNMLNSGEDRFLFQGTKRKQCIVNGVGATFWSKYFDTTAVGHYMTLVKLPWGVAATSGGAMQLPAWEGVLWNGNRYSVFIIASRPGTTWEGMHGFMKTVWRFFGHPSDVLNLATYDAATGWHVSQYPGMANANTDPQTIPGISTANFYSWVSSHTNNQAVSCDFSNWQFRSGSTYTIQAQTTTTALRQADSWTEASYGAVISTGTDGYSQYVKPYWQPWPITSYVAGAVYSTDGGRPHYDGLLVAVNAHDNYVANPAAYGKPSPKRCAVGRYLERVRPGYGYGAAVAAKCDDFLNDPVTVEPRNFTGVTFGSTGHLAAQRKGSGTANRTINGGWWLNGETYVVLMEPPVSCPIGKTFIADPNGWGNRCQ